MGLGIAAMHYTGMAAMQMEPKPQYDPVVLGLSVIIAIGASFAALAICFRLRSQATLSALKQRMIASLVMGTAIVGMHYTGMAATIFPSHAETIVAPSSVDNAWLAIAVATFALLLFATAMFLALLDTLVIQHDLRAGVLERSERRFRRVLQNSYDAFVSMGEDGLVKVWNDRSVELFGWRREEAVGRELADLIIPPSQREAHRAGMARFRTTGEGRVLNKRLELTARNRAGGEFPVEITIGVTESGENKEFFAFLRDISQRKATEKELHHRAQHDALTSLPNRTLFADRLSQSIARAKRSGRLVAVMYLDIDHFKRINDSFGHAVGDELLQAFAHRLNASVREPDTVARLGGDEFTVLAEGLQTSDDASVLAEKIVQRVAEPIETRTTVLHISTSIGVALYSRDGDQDSNQLLVRADQALYQAKRDGRNTFRIANDEISKPDLSAATTPGMPFEATPGPSSFKGAKEDGEQSHARKIDRLLCRMMSVIRNHLDMETAFISEFTEGQRVFRYVDSGLVESPIAVGGSEPLSESYCQRIIDGRLPEIIHDAFELPAALELEATTAVPVRGHLSVAITLSDGTLYGTFCFFSSRAHHGLNERDLALIRAFALVAGEEISELKAAEKRRQLKGFG